MAEDFFDVLFSNKYLKATSALEHGTSVQAKGLIFIENELDKAFWSKLFSKDILKNYSFSMASGPSSVDDGARGKCRFYNNFKKANSLAIFAIDADFSHLTPLMRDYHLDIINNEFIFHTYGYNKESICNCAEVIDSCLEQYIYFDDSDYRVSDFLINYSQIIYRPLLSYLYILNSKKDIISDSDFHKVVIPENVNMYFSNDWTGLISSCESFMASFDQSSEADFDNFVESTKAFGLNENNSCYYINGHYLEKRVINKISLGIKRKIISDAIENLKKSGAHPSTFKDRISEINNYFDCECNFATLRNMSVSMLKSDMYILISKQFSVLNS